MELNMLLIEEHFVCTSHECGAELVVKAKPAISRQNMRCACGSDLKRLYRPPVLTVYGTASEIGQQVVDLGGSLARLENLKRLRQSTGQ